MDRSTSIALGIALLAFAIAYWWWYIRVPTPPQSINSGLRHCPDCSTTEPLWAVMDGVLRDGDDILPELNEVTSLEARTACIASPACKSFSFWGENATSKKGKALLKSTDPGIMRRGDGFATHVLKR